MGGAAMQLRFLGGMAVLGVVAVAGQRHRQPLVLVELGAVVEAVRLRCFLEHLCLVVGLAEMTQQPEQAAALVVGAVAALKRQVVLAALVASFSIGQRGINYEIRMD